MSHGVQHREEKRRTGGNLVKLYVRVQGDVLLYRKLFKFRDKVSVVIKIYGKVRVKIVEAFLKTFTRNEFFDSTFSCLIRDKLVVYIKKKVVLQISDSIRSSLIIVQVFFYPSTIENGQKRVY